MRKLVNWLRRKTDEWSRKRVQENPLAYLERDRIRQVLVEGQGKWNQNSRENLAELEGRSPVTDFFLRE